VVESLDGHVVLLRAVPAQALSASISSTIFTLSATDEATGLERDVPLQAEVLAADLGLRGEARLRIVPRVDRDAVELELEVDLLGDALDGEVGVQHVAAAGGLDARADEGPRGVVLDVEEVAAAQVAVAALVAQCRWTWPGRWLRPSRTGSGSSPTVMVPAKSVKLAADLRDHEVTDAEADSAVAGVDGPGARCEGGEAGVGGGDL
jgi:hypothetical protein